MPGLIVGAGVGVVWGTLGAMGGRVVAEGNFRATPHKGCACRRDEFSAAEPPPQIVHAEFDGGAARGGLSACGKTSAGARWRKFSRPRA